MYTRGLFWTQDDSAKVQGLHDAAEILQAKDPISQPITVPNTLVDFTLICELFDGIASFCNGPIKDLDTIRIHRTIKGRCRKVVVKARRFPPFQIGLQTGPGRYRSLLQFLLPPRVVPHILAP